MGKTFYWVGGATGSTVLEAYNWNNPKNWIVQNATIGGVATTTINQDTIATSTTTSSNSANRFNISTGSIGSAVDTGSYCPGIGDVVIVGELPAIGNKTPKQVKAPLLYGGCGITSGAGWTAGTAHATWQNAQESSGSFNNIGIQSITVKNSFLPNTTTPVYPFEWIGGGITSANSEILSWVESQNSGEDIKALCNSSTSDLRLIVKEHVTTKVNAPFETVDSKPIKVSMFFKAGVKQTIPQPAGNISVVRTKFNDSSSYIALGLFSGFFDSVTIKTDDQNGNNSPDTRYIMISGSYLNDVFVDRYAGNLYMDSSTVVNKMNMTNTVWMGMMRGILQDITIESDFDGPAVRSMLGYSGVISSESSTLRLGPCVYISPSAGRSGYGTEQKYNIQYPPTLNLGISIGETLVGEYQEITSLFVEGQNYNTLSFLDGRWNLSFKGNVNINYLNGKACIIKANPYAPLITQVRVGNAELFDTSEITFTRSCPIIDAGDQDIWYFGEMSDKLRGGLKFFDSTGLIYGSKGIVMANSFEDRNSNKDSRTGDIDYLDTDVEATITTNV